MAERIIRFTFLVNPSERQLITAIAERLCRTQADVLRLLVKAAADELRLGLEKVTQDNNKTQGVNHG